MKLALISLLSFLLDILEQDNIKSCCCWIGYRRHHSSHIWHRSYSPISCAASWAVPDLVGLVSLVDVLIFVCSSLWFVFKCNESILLCSGYYFIGWWGCNSSLFWESATFGVWTGVLDKFLEKYLERDHCLSCFQLSSVCSPTKVRLI